MTVVALLSPATAAKLVAATYGGSCHLDPIEIVGGPHIGNWFVPAACVVDPNYAGFADDFAALGMVDIDLAVARADAPLADPWETTKDQIIEAVWQGVPLEEIHEVKVEQVELGIAEFSDITVAQISAS